MAISIIEGYIIFGGPEFLNRHASSLVKLLDGIVGNVNDKGLLSLFPVIDILIQVNTPAHLSFKIFFPDILLLRVYLTSINILFFIQETVNFIC